MRENKGSAPLVRYLASFLSIIHGNLISLLDFQNILMAENWYQHFHRLARQTVKSSHQTKKMKYHQMIIGRIWHGLSSIVFYWNPSSYNEHYGQGPSADVLTGGIIYRKGNFTSWYSALHCGLGPGRVRLGKICWAWQDLEFLISQIVWSWSYLQNLSQISSH